MYFSFSVQVTQWGFAGENLGYIAFESADGSGPAGRQPVSEELSVKIDKEVSKLCDEAFKTTMETLKASPPPATATLDRVPPGP